MREFRSIEAGDHQRLFSVKDVIFLNIDFLHFIFIILF